MPGRERRGPRLNARVAAPRPGKPAPAPGWPPAGPRRHPLFLFGGVRAILEQGGADVYLNARTDFLEALLRRDRGEAEEALGLAGRALRTLFSLGERDRARVLSEAGQAGVPLQLLTPPQGSPTAVH